MRKLIGKIGVDSGQVMIGDPCYLSNWVDNDFGDKAACKAIPEGDYSYIGACKATTNHPYGVLNYAGCGGEGYGVAVVSSTYCGDGEYPVYAEVDYNGKVRSITIDFDPEPEDEDEDEDE